ncbi:MAG: hypothetical protein JSU65_13860, partial [Candidatus Zixiibacteriota bacterium]
MHVRRTRFNSFLILVVPPALWLLSGPIATADEGSTTVKAGFVVADEEGNLAVNQETFNTYEGLALSVEDFRYQLAPRWRLSADLLDLTLNNRNLSARLSNQGRFKLDLHHDKYRRRYDFGGANFTRRSTTSADISFSPIRQLELFTGLSLMKKHGARNDAIDVTEGRSPVDYSHTAYLVGGRYSNRRGSASVQYRRLDFENDVPTALHNIGRQADEVRTSASLVIPGAEWLLVSGGYDYRQDQLDASGVKLTTNLGWAGIKATLPKYYRVDYNFSFARTTQTTLDQETDNAVNAITVSRNWPGVGGVSVGYENRIADDLVDRTESHGLLLGSWFNWQRRLSVRASLSLRDQDVVDGITQVGDRSVTRYRITARYRETDLWSLELQWAGRVSKHDPHPDIREASADDELDTRVDYDGLSMVFSIDKEKYGRLTLSHTYYLGKYENNSDETS